MKFKDICINAYKQLISNRKVHPLSKDNDYCERHHMNPVSLGGSNDDENLVNLSVKEHFIAHYLLYRIFRRTFYESKMAHALWMLCRYNSYHKRLIPGSYYKLAKRIMANAKIGCHWWTNGSEQRFCKVCPGPGFKLGYLKKSQRVQYKPDDSLNEEILEITDCLYAGKKVHVDFT